MKIQHLGTAAAEGWPGLFCTCNACRRARTLGGKNLRTRSQALIDGTLLVDFPPDSYLHMQRDGLDLPHIHHLLITHTHQDHLLQDTLAFHEIAPFTPQAIGPHTVTALPARHNPAERCYIYLIERDGQALLYGNDTGIFPEEAWAYLAGRRLDLVSLDCTMLMHREGTNHMGIPDVFDVQDRLMADGIADAQTVFVITHFSHNGVLMHDEIEARVGPRGILTAYDGMEVAM